MSNFNTLQQIAEISLGLFGFSSILIGLGKSIKYFNLVYSFRVQLLIYSSLGSMFGFLIPFAVFYDNSDYNTHWIIVSSLMTIYVIIGLFKFPKQMRKLRTSYPELFPLHIYIIQTGILVCIFSLSLSILFNILEFKSNGYIILLILYLIQSTIAFVRTIFYRA